MNMHSILESAESARIADRPADAIARVVRRVLRATRLSGLLRGSWLGHPVHPLLVAVPIGAWTSAAVLDCCGQRTAARQLIAIGLAATPPTALVGLADFAELDTEQRRVAVLHAAANVVSSGLFVGSYVSRRRGNGMAGPVWSGLGLLVLGAAGALGGHLSYAQGAGVYRWQAVEDEARGHSG